MMKKALYIQPTIKVVKFQVESGFAGSVRLGESIIGRRSDYATGETYTQYTDNEGQYDYGRWN